MANSKDHVQHLASWMRMWMVVLPSLPPDLLDERSSMSSELVLARWTVMELFMADKHLDLPAATKLHVLDQPCLRHLCAALGRCPVSS